MSCFVGIEKLSLVDFDGKIACTLFTKKCNFRCPFCHNASLVLGDEEELSFEKILTFLKSRVGLLEAVCITGGEPTVTSNLLDLIREIKKLGFEIKLDTNGYHPDILKTLIDEKMIDYVAMDIKNSPSNYAKTVGLKYLEIEKINESLNILKKSNIPYELRTTLVEEFHDMQSIKDLGIWLNGQPVLYLQHFIDQGNCIQENLHEVEKEQAIKYKEILEKNIKNVYLRGY